MKTQAWRPAFRDLQKIFHLSHDLQAADWPVGHPVAEAILPRVPRGPLVDLDRWLLTKTDRVSRRRALESQRDHGSTLRGHANARGHE